jgi:DNA gyrase inhibitor GyrI
MAGEDGDGSFGRLFRFISGRNEKKQKIAMTTPVYMSGSDEKRTMAFVMPSEMSKDEVPLPSDSTVTLREMQSGRFAVLRFSGERSSTKEAEMLNRLKTWMDAKGLVAVASPIYGYFDPPWTPSFLRRNEVMLQTQ